jgi:hypothetical protein
MGPLVQHISNYPGVKPATPVSTVWVHNRVSHVTSKIVESALCDGVMAADEAKLSIHCHKVGTHSIQAGAAMAMYLGGVPVFAIMMIGQWSSTAFMKYIRKQIKEFTLNVLKNMLTMQHFLPCLKHNKQSKKEGIWQIGQHDACLEYGIGIKPGRPGPGKGQTIYLVTPSCVYFTFPTFVAEVERPFHKGTELQSSNSVCCV